MRSRSPVLRVRLRTLPLLLALTAPGWLASAAAAEQPSLPRLVKIHADWCGTCVALEPTWEALVARLGDRLEPHVFDVTDRARLRASRERAASLGLADFLSVNKGRTGTVALIAPDGRVIETFKGRTPRRSLRVRARGVGTRPGRVSALAAGPDPRIARHPAFVGTLVVAGGLAAWLVVAGDAALLWLTELELAVSAWLPEDLIGGASRAALPLLGFAAGVLASISPCILPLVPLNAALIGAADASGRAAVSLSLRFVSGASVALAILGLASDFAGWILIEQRGVVLIVAGLVMVVLAAMALEWAPVPWAGRALGGTRQLGPVVAGAAFALVTTPCASPLIGGLLAAALAKGTPGLGAGVMLAFGLGYTALVFVAGVFGGGWIGRLRHRSRVAPRAVSAAVLLVAGLVTVSAGWRWW